jgi:DHA2 family multidrug resistance protein
MGSSIFISLSVALVIRETQISRAEMTPHVSRFNEAYRMPGISGNLDLGQADSLARIGGEMGRQATMMGYISGFLLFAGCAAIALPLIALVRVRRPG